MDAFWATRNQFVRQAINMYALSRIVVRSRNDLNDLIARELERRDVASRACHEVTVEYAQNGLVGYDEEIVVFAFEFEDDGFKSDGEVVV